MFNALAIKALNLLLKANPHTCVQLQKLATKIVELKLPLLTLNFIIAPDGMLETEDSAPDCSITIPLASAGHLIHQDQLQTFKTLQITGDKNLATNLLASLATLDASKILYLSDSTVLGIFAIKLEQLLKNIIEYAKLVSHNAGLSGSQYIQYEIDLISDKYALEQFYRDVDNLKERCDLLGKRVERLTQ